MNSQSPEPEAAEASAFVVVYRGARAPCFEFALVLDAQGVEREVFVDGSDWALAVPAGRAALAHEEISRYALERSKPPARAAPAAPFPGAWFGAAGYSAVLLAGAYGAGAAAFGADWAEVGALRSGAIQEWWRAWTALTLHADQAHLLGNLLFGVVLGVAASRVLGAGLAWASILAAAVLANLAEMVLAPPLHQSIGASTAVFAALGLLAGLAWRQRLLLPERRWYRFAPLLAGLCLLTLFGAGTPHVDVLGHLLGFVTGTVLGWWYARMHWPRSHCRRWQIAAGGLALASTVVAWAVALAHAA